MAGSGQRMCRPPGGISNSGRTMLTRPGETSTEAEVSMLSVMHFMPTHRPAKRDMAQPYMPMSSRSC
ncbi:MAG TPA: hypothetical protein DC046_09560, partial [Rhodospirillaceae bacterium]|nr:hypothetical protein [Rhodospirillaceae bacterium]